VREPSPSEVEVSIGKLEGCKKSAWVDHIPGELIQAPGETLHFDIVECRLPLDRSWKSISYC
jgi:hypothetical protein